MSFEDYIQQKAELFNSLEGPIRLFGHIDADGLAASAILSSLFDELKRDYKISIIPQLTDKELEGVQEPIIFFADMGSENLDIIEKHLKGKKVFIIDHHSKNEGTVTALCNPWLFGYDGARDISGAGVACLFAQSLIPNLDVEHIAIVGALADVQEKPALQGFNKKILDRAIKKNLLEVKTTLNLFGSTKPIHKVLEFSVDMQVPNITRNRDACFLLLKRLNIDPKKLFRELTAEEIETLTKELIQIKGNRENIFKTAYLLKQEPQNSPLRDAKEFCTVLNACGRLEDPQLGIRVCQGDEEAKTKIFHQLEEYKKSIGQAMAWVRTTPKDIHQEEGIMIINAKDNINPNIIGTIASILSKSRSLQENTFIFGLARRTDNTTKISARYQGKPPQSLRGIMERVTVKTSGTFGGHFEAAGALIPTDKEEECIKAIKEEVKIMS